MPSVFSALRGLFVHKDASNTNASPRSARLAFGGLQGRSATGAVQTGVMVDQMTPVVTGTAATGPMTVSIRPCVIVSQFAPADGATITALDTPTPVPVEAAPDTNSRIDLVWVRQNRLAASDGGAGADNRLELGVTTGTVSGSPTAPAAPPGAIALATFPVAAGTTSTAALVFTPAHEWVTANGGLTPAAKGSRQLLAWNGTEVVSLYAGNDPTLHQVTVSTSPGGLWSSDLWITQQATAFGMEMTLRGRLIRNAGAFTIGNNWDLDVGGVALPAAMKPNLGSADLNLIALHNGYRPFAVLLRADGRMFLRSAPSDIAFGANDFIDIPGQSWTRTG